MKVLVIGCGNGAFATAGDLSNQGHQVTLFVDKKHAKNFDEIKKDNIINCVGIGPVGPIKIHKITCDLEDAIKEYDKMRYQRDKDKRLEYCREYHKENKESIKKQRHQYYEENKDIIKERNKRYWAENPHVRFNSTSKRRQLEKSQGEGITKEQWLEMMDFFEWKCAYSGEYIGGNSDSRTIDHIIPLDNEGEHAIWNCVPCYGNYNFSKRLYL